MFAQDRQWPCRAPLFRNPGLPPVAFGTEAAIDRTLIGDHEQDAVGVPVDQMRTGLIRSLFERIVFQCTASAISARSGRPVSKSHRLSPDGAQHRRGDAHGVVPTMSSISSGSTPSRSARSFGFTTLWPGCVSNPPLVYPFADASSVSRRAVTGCVGPWHLVCPDPRGVPDVG